jgi:DNA (cytosine-5)-methyltransferase 1
MAKFKFIDLFSGIGGFHIAMNQLDGECVFSSEIDEYAIETYKQNFNIDSNNDIREVDPSSLPHYDVMCAGFPCQAFSKAGKQHGFKDETKGTLFFEIERLLRYKVENKNPVKYIILENVSNLVSHDRGRTWKIIKKHLLELGYNLTEDPIILSPHQLNIPQLRNRVFILGIHNSFNEKLNIEEPQAPLSKRNTNDAYSIVSKHRVPDKYYISEYEEYVLSVWDEFYKNIKEKVIGFPIWAFEFNDNPIDKSLPLWKQNFIRKNRDLYNNNREFIDSWLKKHKNLSLLVETHKKFEWQAGKHINSVWDGIIQFRPSGIRVKRPTEFPALVAMVHIPIIGKYSRRITPKEVARLQSFPEDFKINKNDQQAYKQFGNSVNVDVVRYLAKQLIKTSK